MKKSFILYLDQQDLFNKLPDEVAGKLIKHIFSYVNLENPETDDLLLDVAFSSIKQSLKRDLKKYDAYIDKQKVNGAKGGRPKTTQITQALIEKPKKADSVSVSVNDSEKNKAFELFWNNYPSNINKKKAMIMFNRLSKTNAALATKDCAIRFQDTEPKFIPHATTYLNGERWNDELPNGVVEEKKGYYGGVKWQ
tara:strand:+ start:3573 stop:4157 length:585 start_codon:yes stop_codon:yes gene_type:complete